MTPCFYLAPLAGITDRAFRQICAEYLADMTFTEMVSADGLVYNRQKTSLFYQKYHGEKNVGVQLFGNKINHIIQAVEILNESEWTCVDFNAGCPVRKVFNNGSGAALLNDIPKLAKILESIKKISRFPVSLKIRIGVKDSDNVIPDIIKIAEDNQLAFLTIHGRSRKQMFSGKANWDMIRESAQQTDIPIIGNGDITTAEQGLSALKDSSLSGIMIGRGALSNPYIFTQLKNPELPDMPVDEKLITGIRHFQLSLEYKNEIKAVNEMRKHWGWYSKGAKGSAEFRKNIFKLTNVEEIFSFVDSYIAQLKENRF